MISLFLSFITLILFIIMSAVLYYKPCYYQLPQTYTKLKVAILSDNVQTHLQENKLNNTMYINYRIVSSEDIHLAVKFIKNNNFDAVIGCNNFNHYTILKSNITNIPIISTGPVLNGSQEPSLQDDVFVCKDLEFIFVKLFEYYASLYNVEIPELIKNTYFVCNIQNSYMVAFMTAAIRSLSHEINIHNYISTNILYNINNTPLSTKLVFYASNGIDLVPCNEDKKNKIPLVFINHNETKYARYSTNKLSFQSYTIHQLTDKRFNNSYIEQYTQKIETQNSLISYTTPLDYTQYNLLYVLNYLSKYTGNKNLVEYLQCLQDINDTIYLYEITETLYGHCIVGEKPVYNLSGMCEVEELIIKANKNITISGDRLSKLVCEHIKGFTEIVIPKSKFYLIN